MKLITANKLNRFWKKGVKPIVDLVALKFEIAKIINSSDTIKALTQEGYVPDALVIKQLIGEFGTLNNNLTATGGEHFRYGITADGKRGYVITGEDGADTVIPFKTDPEFAVHFSGSQHATTIPTHRISNLSFKKVNIVFDPFDSYAWCRVSFKSKSGATKQLAYADNANSYANWGKSFVVDLSSFANEFPYIIEVVASVRGCTLTFSD